MEITHNKYNKYKHIMRIRGTPTKRPVTQRPVKKHPVTKRSVTERPGYKTSIYQTSSYRTSRIQNIQDTKCPVFVNFKLVFKKPFCEKYQGFTSIYRQLNANFGYFCPQMTIQIFLLEIRVFSATFVPESFHNHA
jgi:hypothetical protein